MNLFKKTKVVYSDTKPDSEEILVDSVINISGVEAVFPGPKPGYIILVFGSKNRYSVKDSVENLFGVVEAAKGKK